MGEYRPGDVLLAAVALDDRSAPKTRPVIVVRAAGTGRIAVCPVSSKPPSDAPSIPLSIDDFRTGGLDLFGESYVMTSRLMVLRTNEVIGKKGHVASDFLTEIAARAPAPEAADPPRHPKAAGPRKRG